MESPSIGALSSMYMYAWKRGLKTTYYLRSRPATRIAKTTVNTYTPSEAVSCSLENPESCRGFPSEPPGTAEVGLQPQPKARHSYERGYPAVRHSPHTQKPTRVPSAE